MFSSMMIDLFRWLPSGYVKIAIENDPVEIVSFPMKNGGSFHGFLYVDQRDLEGNHHHIPIIYPSFYHHYINHHYTLTIIIP